MACALPLGENVEAASCKAGSLGALEDPAACQSAAARIIAYLKRGSKAGRGCPLCPLALLQVSDSVISHPSACRRCREETPSEVSVALPAHAPQNTEGSTQPRGG